VVVLITKVVFVGVEGAFMVVDCAEVEIMDARFGINLQSRHKPDGVLGLSMSSVDVIVGGAAFTSALILLAGQT
jgi:hypothetical protein